MTGDAEAGGRLPPKAAFKASQKRQVEEEARAHPSPAPGTYSDGQQGRLITEIKAAGDESDGQQPRGTKQVSSCLPLLARRSWSGRAQARRHSARPRRLGAGQAAAAAGVHPVHLPRAQAAGRAGVPGRDPATAPAPPAAGPAAGASAGTAGGAAAVSRGAATARRNVRRQARCAAVQPPAAGRGGVVRQGLCRQLQLAGRGA